MKLIDTHCHLDFKDFDSDRIDVLKRAKDSGVENIINIGSSVDGSMRSVALSNQFSGIFASVGIHPHDASSLRDGDIDILKNLIKKNKKVVAVGEIGLDYYRNLSPKPDQEFLFREMLKISDEFSLPVVIHSREASDDTVSILKSNKSAPVKGVMHCFSGDKKFLDSCMDMGFYISFTCNITFKNAAKLREIVKFVPIERILLETDAPFLSPENLRGKRNEPANLIYLVKILSEIKLLSEDDIARITTHNANTLFNLGLSEPKNEVTYNIRNSLYLNITNRCTDNCIFCVRNKTDFVKGHNLKLENEPSSDEILKAIGDPSKYKEIVFCGYGEPTLRLDTVIAVSKELKKKKCTIRLVTNGHGNVINKCNIADKIKGLIDMVSVSLNTDTKASYNKFCRPTLSEDIYDEIKKFIVGCKNSGISVEATCLDLPGVDLKKCREIIENELGVSFRLRHLDSVG